jgi:hypothetical protein
MTANMKDDLFVGVTTWDSELLLDIDVCIPSIGWIVGVMRIA